MRARIWTRRCAFLLILIVGLPIAANASPANSDQAQSFFSCRRDYPDRAARLKSNASLNLYHGLAYFGGTAGVRFGATPTRRWSGTNGFDTGIRDGLRIGSTSGRRDAVLASDITLALTAGILPVATIASSFRRNHDCVETWEMFGETIESVGLTLFVTEIAKFASGRERSFSVECDASPPKDADCTSDDRNRSFFSGHASLAAAGAGLTCSFSFKREAWGSSTAAKASPCILGIAAAAATGLLRVSSDRHWGSDVLVGFALGGLIGFFDTLGPLDLLKFKTRDSKGHISSTGIVMPEARNGRFGARVVMVF